MIEQTILVSGASGFVGRGLCEQLAADGIKVVGLGRSNRPEHLSGMDYFNHDLETDSLDGAIIGEVDCVIHLAGQAHGKGGSERQQLDGFRRANVSASVKLAESAIRAGVRRFVFVSSIGVHGTSTNGELLSDVSPVMPASPYTASKLEAEKALTNLFERNSQAELVIVRPPLVYGDEAPGNFRSLLKLAASGLPLPFGMCSNRRSLVSLGNLVSFLKVCVDHPNAGNQSFVVADGDAVSTRDIVSSLREGMGLPSRLAPVPPAFMGIAMKVFGKSDMYTQLFGDLEVDCCKAEHMLDWTPNHDTLGQLEAIGRRYVNSHM